MAFGVVAVLSVVIGVPVGVSTIRDDHLAREEAHQIRGLIADPSRPGDVPAERKQLLVGRAVAGYLDSLHLADGKVLVDVALGFPVVLQSGELRQFVITPDRDFPQVLAAPVTFGVDYILVPPGGGLGGLDAVGRQFPGLYQNGGGLPVTLVREWTAEGTTAVGWRLYRIDRPAGS